MNAFPTPSHSYTASVKTATQSSIVSGSTSRRSSCSTSRRGVEHPHYRSTNLADHSITFREYYEEIPESLRPLLDRVREDRGSPTPSLDVVELAKLETDPHEDTVEEYFKKDVFPLKWGPTRRDSKLLMHREDLPEKTNFQSDLTLTQPKPDIVYGLSRNEAFPQHVSHLSLLGNYMIANTRDLLWPFFVIEMKADGPGKSGSLYTATNQCLNASSSCVNIREKLASQLKYSNSADVNMPDTAAFAIAMSGTEARLYICWKERLEYRMQRVSAYLLQRPSDYEGFRKHVRNILDWGSTERLQTILRGLDSLAQSCGEYVPVAGVEPQVTPSSHGALAPSPLGSTVPHPPRHPSTLQGEDIRSSKRQAGEGTWRGDSQQDSCTYTDGRNDQASPQPSQPPSQES